MFRRGLWRGGQVTFFPNYDDMDDIDELSEPLGCVKDRINLSLF